MQLLISLYVTAMFNRKSDACATLYQYPQVSRSDVYKNVSEWSLLPGIISPWITQIYGSIMLGMILFKLLFNLVLEATCSYGTNDWRTFMFVLSDLVDLFVILSLDGSSPVSSPPYGGGNPLARGFRYMVTRLWNFISKKGPPSCQSPVSTRTLVIHSTILVGSCGIWYALMFSLIKATDQRLC